MFSLFSRARARKNAESIARLYADLVAAARAPRAFAAYGVPDTFEGRFEMLALMATLVLDRLSALPPPAAEVAQDLVDHLFKDLDAGLRLMGISDLGVPKKMKVLAKSFYGRSEAYRAALNSGDAAALRAAMARNLFSGALGPEAISPDFMAEIAAQRESLAGISLEALLAGGQWVLAREDFI